MLFQIPGTSVIVMASIKSKGKERGVISSIESKGKERGKELRSERLSKQQRWRLFCTTINQRCMSVHLQSLENRLSSSHYLKLWQYLFDSLSLLFLPIQHLSCILIKKWREVTALVWFKHSHWDKAIWKAVRQIHSISRVMLQKE